MLLKFKCNDNRRKIVHACTITFINEETAIYSFSVSKNLENYFLEALSDELFSNPVPLHNSIEDLKQIKFGDLHYTIKTRNVPFEKGSQVTNNLKNF